MLVGSHEVGAPRFRIEALHEEPMLVAKVFADDKNTRSLRDSAAILHMQDGFLSTQRFQKPDRLSIALKHGSVWEWRAWTQPA